MKRYLLLMTAAIFALAGCTERGIIPERKMSAILHDMYVLDAQVSDNSEYRSKADTLSVYGGLLEIYGYTADEFNASIEYYLQQPAKFKEIFAAVKKQFDEETAQSEIEPAGRLNGDEDPVERQIRTRGSRRRNNAQEPQESTE